MSLREDRISSLPALQRVFLSNNKIESFECISSIFRIKGLAELSLDGNPVADNRWDAACVGVRACVSWMCAC